MGEWVYAKYLTRSVRHKHMGNISVAVNVSCLAFIAPTHIQRPTGQSVNLQRSRMASAFQLRKRMALGRKACDVGLAMKLKVKATRR
jgi:hypothetical protein